MKIYRYSLLIALAGLSLCACKKTERTAPEARKHNDTQQTASAEEAKPTPTAEPQAEPQPTAEPQAEPQPTPEAQPEPAVTPEPQAEEPATTPAEPTPEPTTPAEPEPPAVNPAEPAAAETPAPAEPTAGEPTATPETSSPQPTLAEQPAPAADVAPTPLNCLLSVRCVYHSYNLIRPWELDEGDESTCCGVYLGKGMVLVPPWNMANATYVELSRTDGSTPVPARVAYCDLGIGLALLTPVHPEDAALFANMQPLPVGEPQSVGDSAEMWGTINGVTPQKVSAVAESAAAKGSSLALVCKLAHIPSLDERRGAPLVKEGKLVGIEAFRRDDQTIESVNADLIHRFLEAAPVGSGVVNSVPVLGVELSPLTDPVFRKYLKIGKEQGGLYVNKVLSGSAAEQAGIAAGDVLTAVEDQPIDVMGNCSFPRYGTLPAGDCCRWLKKPGEMLTLTVSRDGVAREVQVPLNRDACDKALLREMKPGSRPPYVVWGGLVFQPITRDLHDKVMRVAGAPLPFLRLVKEEQKLREAGVTEPVAITMIVPTPATLSYESLQCNIVREVNGKPVRNFAEFKALLDEPTESDIVSFTISSAPYTIYMSRKLAAVADEAIRRSAIPVLRSDEAAPQP